jgi:hypothetical protein
VPYDQEGNWLGDSSGESVDATTERRRRYHESERWLVDPIFPSGAMHLIGGASGAGKTTWLLQQLWEWDQGLPLFGKYKSNPVPWVYIACDRSLRDTNQTLQRLGYHKWQFEAYALEDLMPRVKVLGGNGIEKIEKAPDMYLHILSKFPDIELFVIEGLQALMPDVSKGRSQNKEELLWALSVRMFLEPQNKTIIATTHSPKVATSGGVTVDARSKFLGSQGFIGTCSTMVGVDKDDKLPNQRQVKVMGRNFAEMDLLYSLDNRGAFQLEGSSGKDGKTVYETDDDRELSIIGYAQSVVEFKTGELHDALTSQGVFISKAHLYRILDQLVQQGVLMERKDGRKLVYSYKPFMQ